MTISSFLLCDLHLIWYFLVYFVLFKFLQYVLFSVSGLLFLPTVIDKWSSLRDFLFSLLVLYHTFLLSSFLYTYSRDFYYFLCSSNIGVLFHLFLIILYSLLPLSVFPPKMLFSMVCTFWRQFSVLFKFAGSLFTLSDFQTYYNFNFIVLLLYYTEVITFPQFGYLGIFFTWPSFKLETIEVNGEQFSPVYSEFI